MIYHDVVQGSQDWHDLRRGVPTASEFSNILTPVKRQFSGGADAYIDRLIAELGSIHYAPRAESYTSRSMDFGQQTEEEARRYIAMRMGLDLMNGGFVTTDDKRFGCSPDFLIRGEKRGGELKCPEEKTHVGYLRRGVLPTAYRCQVHGALIVTGYSEWLFMSYAQGWDPLTVIVKPDDFTEALKGAMEQFWARYQDALAKIRGM